MRLIALSIVILAGAIMASVDSLGATLTNGRSDIQLGLCGYIMMAIAGLMFVIEWWPMPREKSLGETAPRLSTHPRL